MVLVPVGNEDKVSGNFFDVDVLRQFVWRDKRIKQQIVSADFNREAGMSVICQFHRNSLLSYAEHITELSVAPV
jgi:hypothetical protein